MDFPGFSLDTAALKPVVEPSESEDYDLLILGGGPAAMSAAIYAARKLMKVAILTKDFGGQMLETSEVENWLGAQSIRARELVTQFEEHVKSFAIPAGVGPAIGKLARKGKRFTAHLDNGKIYRGKAAIIATGKRHRPLNVPGELEFKGRGVAYCATCDAPFYRRKKVVVAGGGNSAFTTVRDLVKVDAEVTMVNHREVRRADRALRQMVERAGRVTYYDFSRVRAIEGKDRVAGVRIESLKDGKTITIPADGVFIEIGLLPNTEFVKDLVELNEQGEIVVDCACRTNVPGLFAAGDVTTVPHKQIVISAGEGAKAALSAYDYLVAKGLI